MHNSYTYTAFTASGTPTPTPTPIPSATPTPTVATPTFSPNGGTFHRSVTVQISCSTVGATIYYTTNGATPTTSSLVYNGTGVTLSGRGTKTLKALGVESGYSNSAVATATYSILRR